VASKAGLKITWMSKIWRSKMQDEFAGRIAVVTGGGAGLGKAAATALLQRGGRVAILDRDISGAPAGAEALQVDVRSDDEVRRAINRFGQMNGCIDFLVNNAGISYPATVEGGFNRSSQHFVYGSIVGIRRGFPPVFSSQEFSGAWC
jgi:NAD(P)-dependent dehydrogenase (short-subunit alcohol dehydrogenase family)